MENELKLRWSRIRQAMQETGADGCLLTMSVNLYYVAGKVFNGYFYLPAEGNPCYFIRRTADMRTDNVFSIRKPEQIPDLLKTAGIDIPRCLLLETDELSYNDCVRLQDIFKLETVENATALLRRLRMIKTPWEIEQLRLSARKHEAVYREIPECFRPGMTDIELQIEIERRMRLHGSIGFFRAFGNNMDIFMGSLLAGENAEEPSPFDFALGGEGIHPSYPLGANGTKLKKGMSVMVDMSGNYTAYQSDMTRVFSIGKLPELAYRANQVALDIQARLEQDVKPGTRCADIYKMTEEMVAKEGLAPYFMGVRQQAKFVGHGVGLQINELPVLTSRSEDVLQPGMVFAFEPKFVLPDIGAVGIENTFLVIENNLDKLTALEEKIVELF